MWKRGESMGQYLMIGVATELQFEQDVLARFRVSAEEVRDMLNRDLDMSLFTLAETGETARFTIRPDILVPQLHPFLSEQLALYCSPIDTLAENALRAVAACHTADDLTALAEEKRHVHFQSSDLLYASLDVGKYHPMRYQCTMFLYVVIGKVYMEVYNDLFRYMQKLIRKTSTVGAIAGAVRVFLQ